MEVVVALPAFAFGCVEHAVGMGGCGASGKDWVISGAAPSWRLLLAVTQCRVLDVSSLLLQVSRVP